MLGCATFFGAVMWLIFFLGLFFGTEAGFSTSVGTGAILGSIFFFAILVVGFLDRLRHSIRLNWVQSRLGGRVPASDEVAMEGVAVELRQNLIETRRSVAEFFGVSEDRLRANDRLDRDYNFVAFATIASLVCCHESGRGTRDPADHMAVRFGRAEDTGGLCTCSRADSD